ncbi:MAG: hypothetical protein ACOX44_10415 [Limnochordia bacterium]
MIGPVEAPCKIKGAVYNRLNEERENSGGRPNLRLETRFARVGCGNGACVAVIAVEHI